MATGEEKRPSLENLVENADLGVEVLHPGGLELTRELAALCHVGEDTKVLDVARGTGESACDLAVTLHCHVVGLDHSPYMVNRARKKAKDRGLNLDFQQGDAHHLPFADNSFDVIISECTTCLLEKERVLREMARVTKPGGYVGIHDLYWQNDAPEHLKHRLVEIEGEKPETLAGWKELFQ